LSQLKKKRPVIGEDGAEDGWEECVGALFCSAASLCAVLGGFFDLWFRYVDYLFPDESGSMASLKILEAARAWKKQKASADEGTQ